MSTPRRILLLPLPLILLLTTAACTSTRVSVQDVTNAAAAGVKRIEGRVPTKADMNPARAANAPEVMQLAEGVARQYLTENAGQRRSWEIYVESVLACILLAQGRTDEAATLAHDFPSESDPNALTRTISMAMATEHATAVCVAIDAREAATRMFRGELDPEQFVRRYGWVAGMQLPGRTNQDFDKFVKLEAAKLRTYTTPGGLSEERIRFHQQELYRMISEQLYNEASSLLVTLPPPNQDAQAAMEKWLARVAVGSAVIYRHYIPDLLPVPLTEDQKEWQREQTNSVFRRAKQAAAYFLSQAARDRLDERKSAQTPDEEIYARMLRSEEAVLGWISLR